MNLGTNQLLLLKRCLYSKKKFITDRDVKLVYGFKDKNKRKLVFEKLEIKGLMFCMDRKRWKLTYYGKQVVRDKLRSIHNGVSS